MSKKRSPFVKNCGNCFYSKPMDKNNEHNIETKQRVQCEYFFVALNGTLPNSMTVVVQPFMRKKEGVLCPCWKRRQRKKKESVNGAKKESVMVSD